VELSDCHIITCRSLFGLRHLTWRFVEGNYELSRFVLPQEAFILTYGQVQPLCLFEPGEFLVEADIISVGSLAEVNLLCFCKAREGLLLGWMLDRLGY